MNSAKFKQLLEQLGGLTDLQLHQLEEHLKSASPIQSLIHQIEQRLIDSPECPHIAIAL